MKADQRRDALLLRVLKTLPLSRAELSAELRRAREAKKAAENVPQPRPKRVRQPSQPTRRAVSSTDCRRPETP